MDPGRIDNPLQMMFVIVDVFGQLIKLIDDKLQPMLTIVPVFDYSGNNFSLIT